MKFAWALPRLCETGDARQLHQLVDWSHLMMDDDTPKVFHTESRMVVQI